MKKSILLSIMSLCFISISSSLSAQDLGGEFYVGARLGGSTGLDMKFYTPSNKAAFELITQFKNFSTTPEFDGLAFTLLYQRFAPFTSSGRFNALVGAGPTFNTRGQRNAGISGMLGFDWRFGAIPFGIQLDWMPTFFVTNGSFFNGADAALSIRYHLGGNKN